MICKVGVYHSSKEKNILKCTNIEHTLTKLRINNVLDPTITDKGICPKCKEVDIPNMAVHIVTECTLINVKRQKQMQQQIKLEAVEGQSNSIITRKIVADKTKENLELLERLFHQWGN